MTNAEKGILMLCCSLGENVMPLPPRQFHGLRKQLELMDAPSDKELTESDLRELGVGYTTAARIVRLLDRERQLDAYLAAGWRSGVCPVTRLNPFYPRCLEQRLGASAPPVLFAKGDVSLLKTSCVGLVGSRRLLEENRRFACRIGELAAVEGYALVSGGAFGADRAAQDACLQNGGRVIVFTPEELYRQPEKERVLYCSEEGWQVEFSAQRALSRNRLIHAMGEKTFVAQCEYRKGGSWRGAEENLKNGYSTVFVFWDGSRGAVGLLEEGAIEVVDPVTIRGLKTGQQSFFEE